MLSSDAVMREILRETLDSADKGDIRESGRTVCGGLTDIRGPAGRYPESVELRACPIDSTGLWHSHVTQDQLLNPSHSLPDMANVVFSSVDTSIIVGVQTADVLLAAEDKGEMQRQFQQALGLDLNGPGDLLTALDNQQIENPPRARNKVRTALAPLFSRVNTGYTDLNQRVNNSPVPSFMPGACLDLPAQTIAVSAPDAGQLRDLARGIRPIETINRWTGDMSIRDQIISTSVGVLVGNFVNSLLSGYVLA